MCTKVLLSAAKHFYGHSICWHQVNQDGMNFYKLLRNLGVSVHVHKGFTFCCKIFFTVIPFAGTKQNKMI